MPLSELLMLTSPLTAVIYSPFLALPLTMMIIAAAMAATAISPAITAVFMFFMIYYSFPCKKHCEKKNYSETEVSVLFVFIISHQFIEAVVVSEGASETVGDVLL